MNDNITRSLNFNLLEIARKAMLLRGLEPDFSTDIAEELTDIKEFKLDTSANLRDLCHLPWCSIDNDDSEDLDQITYAEQLPLNRIKILVAIADVDASVKIGQAIDRHAQQNTSSVYTGVKIFPMLPEKLSTHLTSLVENRARLAVIMEMVIDQDGEVLESDVYRAIVKNQAKLAYNSVASWLDGFGPLPKAAQRIKDMEQQLRLQDHAAQKMRTVRYMHGALELDTNEARTVMKDGLVAELKQVKKNRARELIEDFMIGANGVSARFLSKARFPTIRRVVKSPDRWQRIMQIAAEYGEVLPAQANAKALGEFLSRSRIADPLRFPDLSLTIIKLLGRGEYVLELPDQEPIGHFGLAIRDYSHSTAPNRRFPDLITQRLLKAAIEHQAVPYSNSQLSFLANHCTVQENAVDKVERQVQKSAAAWLLSSRMGEIFEGIVTGSSNKGVWGRVLNPPVEGKIIRGPAELMVGQRLRLKLVGINIERGFIDFEVYAM